MFNKCAEVFCQNFENYAIVCVDCDLKTSAFSEFITHYQNVHCPLQPSIKVELVDAEAEETHSQADTNIKRESHQFEFEHEIDEQQIPNSNEEKSIESSVEVNPLDCPNIVCLKPTNLYSNRPSLRKHLRLHSHKSTTQDIIPTPNEDDSFASHTKNELTDIEVLKLKKSSDLTVQTDHKVEGNADHYSSSSENSVNDEQPCIENKKKKPKQFDCPKCEKKYFCRKSFRLHLSRNHPDIDTSCIFACSVCPGEYFSSRKALNRHKRESHSVNEDNGNYLCPYCAKQYTKRHSLAGHLRTVHKVTDQKTKSYPCTQCERVFSERFRLKRHEIRHTGQRNFICPEPNCGLAFYDPKGVNAHKRRMHIGLKKFICDICGFATKTPGTLRTHIRSHTGEKPYKCDQCDKCFTTSSAVVEHKVIHNSQIRPYVCDVCGKSFSRPKALYHHKPLHLNVKKFVCKICGKAYAQQAGLSAHKRQHALDISTT